VYENVEDYSSRVNVVGTLVFCSDMVSETYVYENVEDYSSRVSVLGTLVFCSDMVSFPNATICILTIMTFKSMKS
jgi:hypothetical protein